MAEAVGLAASIVALAGLAHTVLKFVGETQNIVRGMGNLGEETGRSIHRIYFAADTIDTAQSTLSEYCAAGGAASQSQVIRFIEDHWTAAFLESESKYLGQHVDRLREGVYALRKRWVPVATMLWRYFIKGQVEDLRDDMQFIQVGLHMLLSCVQLEIAVNRQKRDEAEMQVELFPRDGYHKRVIKQQEKEIKRLGKDRVNVSAGMEGIDQQYTVPGQHLEMKVQLRVILKLAATIRRTETVPQSSRTTPSTGLSTSAASTRSTSETRTYEGEQPIPRPDPPVLPRLPSVSSLHVLPRGPCEACGRHHQERSNMDASKDGVMSRPDVSSKTRSRARNHPEALTNSAVSQTGSELGLGRLQALVAPRTPSIHSDDDFIGVTSGEAFRIVTSPEKRIEQGHIRYRDGDKIAAVAKIKPEQAFNFMTAIRASKLGLSECVQPYEDDDEETWIVLPSGKRIRPDGTIQLRWYPRQSRSISLRFFVLSGWWEREIVLGAQYVAKEEHYAKRKREGKE